MSCGGVAVRVDESADFGVIISALEVVEPGFAIIVIPTIAKNAIIQGSLFIYYFDLSIVVPASTLTAAITVGHEFSS